ncbi:MAG: SulP family inorganic anion transporter [Lachnospiraceae bacterium]|nr:SulP family inorganic anion transporter [Lachnospiraceae bacterium]
MKPKIFSVMKHYNAKQFFLDMKAGIIVAIIALPLSIAFALGCGVSAEKGIYSAIISGIIVAILGGSRVQITGPTGAFIVITQSVIAGYGMQGLIVSTILAGVILILLGVFRLGKLIKYIPSPITIGFTGGIAITIATLEVKDFLGFNIASMPTSFLGKWQAYFSHIKEINWQALVLGLVSIVILVIWPKINKTIPNSFVALVIGTAATYFLKLDVALLGDIPKTISVAKIEGLSFDMIFSLMSPAFTIAILVAMQALLSAVVTDGMINSKHKPNAELVAQGAANMVLGIFGCIPATGGVARSIANAKNGARTPIALMFHSVTLLVMLLFGMPLIRLVPRPVLAAILLVVSYNMFNVKAFLAYRKAPKSDTIVLITSCVLTFAFDLVLAIEVGIVLSCVLFMKRMSDVTDVSGWKYIRDVHLPEEENDPEQLALKEVPEGTEVFEVNGPMFFGAVDKLLRLKHQTMKKDTKVVIIRMRGVPAIDATAMNTLRDVTKDLNKYGITVIFSHVLEQPRSIMDKNGFIDMIGSKNFCENIDAALARANELLVTEKAAAAC